MESLKYFQSALEFMRLEKYDEHTSSRASLVKFKNEFFRLQLLNDRGISETNISPLFGEELFLGIEQYYSLLTLERAPNNLSTIEKKKIIGTRLDFKSQSQFLLENFDWLKIVLNKKNYESTLERLMDIYK